MTVSPPEGARPALSLKDRIGAALAPDRAPALIAPERSIPLAGLATRHFLSAPAGELRGRCVLVRTRSPLAAALALTSLDGIAARLILCPPDLDAAQLVQAATTAGADTVVSDVEGEEPSGLARHRITLETSVEDGAPRTAVTEWALFTSGTSGAPKMVAHTLAGLTGAIAAHPGRLEAGRADAGAPTVWATFYDVRRYGGLQMLLRALTGGASLLVTDAHEPLADFLDRVREHGVTHLAGTPSHWRRALMSPALAGVSPRYVRLSGEIADQAVLDSLRARFPEAAVGHAYASTEAGVGFEVTDGLAGFPIAFVEREDGPVRMRVVDETLQLRSPRTAHGYLGDDAPPLGDAEGWVDTGDLLERRGERFHFLGRRSGVINVGGLKIAPEEVEAVINACPGVRMSRVLGRASPLLGALVAAEVVLADAGHDAASARGAILAHCRARLPPHKTPASIRFVEALKVGAAGKLERRGA